MTRIYTVLAPLLLMQGAFAAETPSTFTGSLAGTEPRQLSQPRRSTRAAPRKPGQLDRADRRPWPRDARGLHPGDGRPDEVHPKQDLTGELP
ncbi:MAG TPA: hypothetical protein QF564_06520 [Pirellulaceae bacterium]|nr:hypothetical protein [Pirellulaceae bacterium]